MKKATTSFFVTIFIILVVIIYLILSKRELHKSGVLLNAKTVGWIPLAEGSLDLEYEFYYKEEKITGNNAFNDFRGNSDFIGHYFPVMYYPGLGGHSQLLIRPSDFKKYNLPFPDSLAWVLSYLNNSTQ